MLKLVVYKNTYAISLIGGDGNIAKAERKGVTLVTMLNFLSYTLSSYFWKQKNYSVRFKGKTFNFSSRYNLASFLAEKIWEVA